MAICWKAYSVVRVVVWEAQVGARVEEVWKVQPAAGEEAWKYGYLNVNYC